MANQRTLWEHLEERQSQEEHRERADKERSRRETFKRLRASGHWLTLLRVARTIPQPFTLNDISVAVWTACPQFFGMKGYPYPDNHKVHYILYGSRGLIAKGIVRRVRQGLFRLPDDLDLESLAQTQPECGGTRGTGGTPVSFRQDRRDAGPTPTVPLAKSTGTDQ